MKKYLILFLLLILYTNINAHELEVNVIDNKNNTITISALLNTGESAVGVLVRLEDKNTKEIIFQKRLPKSNQLTTNIPKVAYIIVFDEGDDDLTIEEGIPPKEGFQEQKKKEKKKSRGDAQISTNNAVVFSIIIAFLLLLSIMFIGKRNTDKLIKELQNKR